MQILNSLKYASNSSVINTVARVADRGKAIDSSGVDVLREAIGIRGKYFTKAEKMYVLASLDKQYQALNAKSGSVPEAARLARELEGLKNQVSNYSKRNNDSVVKRFRDGITNVVDGISSVTSGISLKPAYAVAALAGVAAVGILGCGDKSGLEIERLKGEKAAMQTSQSALRADYSAATNQTAQVTAERNTLRDKIKILEGQLARAGRPDSDVRREAIAEARKGMVSQKAYDDMRKNYDDKLKETIARIGALEGKVGSINSPKPSVPKVPAAINNPVTQKQNATPAPVGSERKDYQKPAQAIPVVKTEESRIEAGRRNVKEDYLVQAAEISRQDKLEAKAQEIHERKNGVNASSKINFPVMVYEHQPGRGQMSISGKPVSYSRKDVIDLSKPGQKVEYLDNPSVPKTPEKKKPTRWERKEADKKYDGINGNNASKSSRWDKEAADREYEKTRYKLGEDLSVPVEPIIVKKKGLGRILEETDKYRQNAVGELSREHETSVKRSADNILAGGYHAYAALTFNQLTPKNHPELNEDDLRPELAAKGLWASVVDMGRRLAGPLNKKEQARAYGHTKDGKKKDILGLTPLIRNIFGLGNVVKNTVNTLTVGLGNNVLENAEWAFDDFGKAGTAYGAAFVNVGREGLVGRLTPKAQIGVNNVVDWLGLVPLNFAGHVVRGEGISHHENLAEAAGNEGYIGVTAESLANMFLMFGSGFVGGSESSGSFTSSFGGGIGGGSGGSGGALGGGIIGGAGGVK